MANTVQIQAALAAEAQAVKSLYNDVFRLKAIRAQLELLGVPQMTAEEFTAVATGNVNHLTLAAVLQLLAAMDVLDAAFLTPVSLAGVTMPPVAAVVAVIR